MAKTKERKNILQTIFKLLSYIVIAFVCAITLFLLYYIVSSQIHANDENYKPGISIYTIVSPSMNPVIEVYDVVVNVKASSANSIQIGDIITYKSQAANSEGMTITHRVVAIDKTEDGKVEYMTQGDNNSEPDSLMVTFDQVIGKEIMILPKLGKIQFLIANQKAWLLLLLIPIGIYLIREFIKLFKLLKLKNRVEEVTNEEPVETITPSKIEIEEKKEQIKLNLREAKATKDSIIKDETEPASFLEPYTETKIKVTSNKYAKLLNNEENKVEVEVPSTNAPSPKKAVKEEIILPKKKEESVINDEYEILDTDEVSSKIKEYDEKLSKLNKMIADIENIKDKKEEKPIEAFIENDDFLNGGRIKVTSIEETKNQKRKVNSKRITEPSKYKPEVKIELTPLIETYNSRTKIARPESVDINEIKNITPIKKETTKKKASLNLNPKKVTKVKSNRTSSEEKTKKTTTKKNLNLNPRTIQKATRNKKPVKNEFIPTKETQNNTYIKVPEKIEKTKSQNLKTPKKKKTLIVIEKIK